MKRQSLSLPIAIMLLIVPNASAQPQQRLDQSHVQASEDDAAVGAAIEQLYSPRFKVRRDASELLWSCGPRVSGKLKAELNVAKDAEVRLRLLGILSDFDFGIVPTAPERRRSLLREYRQANIVRQREIFESLVAESDMAIVAPLIRFQNLPATREAMLTFALHNKSIALQHASPKLMHQIVVKLMHDQSAVKQRDAVGRALFLPPVLNAIVAKNQFGQLAEFIKKQKPEDRRYFAKSTLANADTVAAIVGAGQLDLLIQIAKSLQAQDQHLYVIGDAFAKPQAARAVVLRADYRKLIASISNSVGPSVCDRLLRSAMASGETVAEVLAQRGFEGLRDIAATASSSQRRAEILSIGCCQPELVDFLGKRKQMDRVIAEVTKFELDARKRFLREMDLLRFFEFFPESQMTTAGVRFLEFSRDNEAGIFAYSMILLLEQYVNLLERMLSGKEHADKLLSPVQAMRPSTQGEWLRKLARYDEGFSMLLQTQTEQRCLELAGKLQHLRRVETIGVVAAGIQSHWSRQNQSAQGVRRLTAAGKRMTGTSQWEYAFAVTKYVKQPELAEFCVSQLQRLASDQRRAKIASALKSPHLKAIASKTDRMRWLLDCLDASDADDVNKVSRLICETPEILERFLAAGHFDRLRQMMRDACESQYHDALKLLFQSNVTAQYFQSAERTQTLQSIANREARPLAKRMMLEGLAERGALKNQEIRVAKP